MVMLSASTYYLGNSLNTWLWQEESNLCLNLRCHPSLPLDDTIDKFYPTKYCLLRRQDSNHTSNLLKHHTFNASTPWALCDFVGVTGLEPATSWSQTRRSSQLNYTPIIKKVEISWDWCSFRLELSALLHVAKFQLCCVDWIWTSDR